LDEWHAEADVHLTGTSTLEIEGSMSILVHTDFSTTGRAPAGASRLQSAYKLASAVLGWPLRVHANRKLLSQMAGMSARELADIGLTPVDLQDSAALPLDTEIGQFLSARATAHRRSWNGRWT
jgi:uncharacterized protein YjiS (DUF1127 family)